MNTRKPVASYLLGDITAQYRLSAAGLPELRLLPAELAGSVPEADDEGKVLPGDCLIQAKLAGDSYPVSYAQGVTMRNGGTVSRMEYEGQSVREEKDRTVIETSVRDPRGYRYVHTLTWTKGDYAVDSVTRFENNSEETVTLEMLSSFSVSGLTDLEPGDAEGCMSLHRIRSRWSAEGRPVTESAEDLQLEPAWVDWGMNSVRYGQAGSMPVKQYFPFGAVEDTKAGVVWAAQLAIESSWQMEFYRRADDMAFSGGLADRELGHWMKSVAPGESFDTPKAVITVTRGGFDEACQRLTHYAKKYFAMQPESEQHLPVMFNEYCTTWGLPSHENIHGILQALRGHGMEYFVVDCGWFVEDGREWSNGMGDYVPSDKLFPGGLKAVADEIRAEGMRPGIWFEIDNVGKDAHVYQNEEMLLHRDGSVLETMGRRFFNMRKPEVQEYLTEKVIGQLKSCGFGYMKMDYNDTIGLGCDGAESLGEGLRLDREASLEFVRKVKREIPDIVLENCASGGHKLEPLMMSICSMASFSDAHECEEIPVIAARLHRTILPAQSQIWAVIRKTDSLKRIAYTLANTFLGRMCLSGDVTELTDAQWQLIDGAVSFYRRIAPVIKDGFSYFHNHRGASDRRLTGWQALLRVKVPGDGSLVPVPEVPGDGSLAPVPDAPGNVSASPDNAGACGAYAVIHRFRGEVPEELVVPLPDGCPERIGEVYAGTGAAVRVENHCLIVTPDEEMEALAVWLY